MPETILLSPGVIILDAENPRVPQSNLGQRDVIQAIAKDQGNKLIKLAEDITEYGINPSESLIVMKALKRRGRFVVLEGNRRLAALRALETPDLLAGAVPAGALNTLRQLSNRYQGNPVDIIACILVRDREEAHHWIELKHAGEMDGAGTVRWGAQERSRYTASGTKQEPEMQALDYLEFKGHLTPNERASVPIASWRRLIGSPDVRSKLGIETPRGELKILAKEEDVAKALTYVAKDLATGRIRTGDIYTKEHRVKYAESLPESIVVTPILKSGEGVDIGTDVPVQKTKPTKKRRQRPRTTLIPPDCVLDITDPRIQDIAKELRRMALNEFTNAVSVLFRVFVELSVDSYIERASLKAEPKAKLRVKLQIVVDDLISQRKLKRQQAKPVRRALQKDSFLAPSIDLFNEYVHNQYMLPAPTDLRAAWDSLQPFITAIWVP